MRANQKGTTLIGELLALAIIASALVLLLTGLSTSSMGVAIQEQRVATENYARRQMEAIKSAPYQADPTAIPYPTVAVTGVYSIEIEVSYWISPTGPFTSTMQAESGLQSLLLRVYGQDATQPMFTLEDYKADKS